MSNSDAFGVMKEMLILNPSLLSVPALSFALVY